jgi:signal transduction histidine kinase
MVRRLSLGLRALKRSGHATFLASLVFWNPVLVFVITFVLGGTHDLVRRSVINLAIGEVVAVECFVAAKVIRALEVRLYEWRRRQVPTHSIAWHLLLAGLFMPFALPLGFRAGGVAAAWLGQRWGTPNLESYRLGMSFGVVIMTVFFLFQTRAEAREAARSADARVKDLEAARLRAQLAALTAEMNPHLLFNALNTVASLIHRDPNRAEEMVLQLSDLYRGVLRSAGAATHTLQEELALCTAYLEIERGRFADRLSVSVDVDPRIDADAIRVPVLVVQPFVENAVKHGISPRARGGRVGLHVRPQGSRVEIVVEDDGVGLGSSMHRGAGRAIANCRDRLALTYAGGADLEVMDAPGGGTRVILALPMSLPEEGTAQ